MKVTEKIQQAEKDGRIWWSFEYFPPRTAQGLQNLLDRIERMRGLGPEFIDITWNAGGRTSDLTSELVKTCQGVIGIETCMHLTCTNMPQEKVDVALREAKANGCRNILALRGDPPLDKRNGRPSKGFQHGIDLTIQLPEAEAKQEMQWLKEKCDAGANFIFTQMFYDADMFIRWVKAARDAGITVPIVPGINPIQTWNGFIRATTLSGTDIPQDLMDILEPHKNNDEKVRELGTKIVSDLCRKILDAGIGIKGLHFYTMNLEKGTKMLLEELNLVPRVETIKPLPWRQSLTPTRRTETIRPIFWANRTKSYLSRTENWDEYPNGRFGDSRSPAYGELDGYGIWIKQTPEEGRKIWGTPTPLVTSRPCSPSLHPTNQSTSVVRPTTNHRNPAVNGARSDDKAFGWGPKNGYVYQKAYLEFFVHPSQLHALIKRIERDTNVTYYAINKQGDLKTNSTSEGPTAVTWGVFPGKEVIQPTIVEAVSFMAWKDEAFELGCQWAKIYEPESPSRKLIENMMDEYFLVNFVHNDFHDREAIFRPFFADAGLQTNGDTETPAVNGVKHVNGLVNGHSTAVRA
ncbi:methylenetetrahydrofolate reductase [Rhizoctonia solani]|uniref:Methylenetetrahydrofolate reductase n=1 Tax=Rhizoctonia solani TaxID=456999 RepID=A0A8H8NR27_9AGAM|nr:methylenetetrahydrofolate reductase [Rhizoctonia solani]QRW17212.1 methylenetetrahydrofolate reductase [Rhizoctonia solani]